MLSLLFIYFELRKLSKLLFLFLRKSFRPSSDLCSCQSTPSQGYSKGKPDTYLKANSQEAIKDSSPADVNEDDEAEVAEAEEEGGVKELAVKTKHKTKQHIMSLFRHGGKKAAGVAGDVSVDGRGKRVSQPNSKGGREPDHRSVPRLTSCCSVVVCQMMGILDVSYPNHSGSRADDQAFPARLGKTSGHIILEGRSHNLLEPRISFVPISGTDATFIYPIDDIVEIKKVSLSYTQSQPMLTERHMLQWPD